MSDQLTFAAPPEWARDTNGEAWWRFHQAHPEVNAALVRLCHEWRAKRPGEQVSIKMLWERLRWEHAIGDLSGEDYRLNNNHTALYARWIMETVPVLAGLFRTRQRLCDGPPDRDATASPQIAVGANGAVSRTASGVERTPMQQVGDAIEEGLRASGFYGDVPPMEIPSVWVVLGFEGRVAHLVKRSMVGDPEVTAACGRTGEPHKGLLSTPRCDACKYRLRQLIGDA